MSWSLLLRPRGAARFMCSFLTAQRGGSYHSASNNARVGGRLQSIPRRVQPDIRTIARLIPPSGNLVQGQNDVALHPELARALREVVDAGLNAYSFFEGVDELRRSIAEKLRLFNGINIDPDRRPLELIVTPG